MSDDLVERLRGEPGPATCWSCGEWGCTNEAGQTVPVLCGCDNDDCDCYLRFDNKCSCDCHGWYGVVRDAADALEVVYAAVDALLAAVDVEHRPEWSDPAGDSGLGEPLWCVTCGVAGGWPCVHRVALDAMKAARSGDHPAGRTTDRSDSGPCPRCADEIGRLTSERDGWQATTAGMSQDLSNAEDAVEQITEAGDALATAVAAAGICSCAVSADSAAAALCAVCTARRSWARVSRR